MEIASRVNEDLNCLEILLVKFPYLGSF